MCVCVPCHLRQKGEMTLSVQAAIFIQFYVFLTSDFLPQFYSKTLLSFLSNLVDLVIVGAVRDMVENIVCEYV